MFPATRLGSLATAFTSPAYRPSGMSCSRSPGVKLNCGISTNEGPNVPTTHAIVTPSLMLPASRYSTGLAVTRSRIIVSATAYNRSNALDGSLSGKNDNFVESSSVMVILVGYSTIEYAQIVVVMVLGCKKLKGL